MTDIVPVGSLPLTSNLDNNPYVIIKKDDTLYRFSAIAMRGSPDLSETQPSNIVCTSDSFVDAGTLFESVRVLPWMTKFYTFKVKVYFLPNTAGMVIGLNIPTDIAVTGDWKVSNITDLSTYATSSFTTVNSSTPVVISIPPHAGRTYILDLEVRTKMSSLGAEEAFDIPVEIRRQTSTGSCTMLAGSYIKLY